MVDLIQEPLFSGKVRKRADIRNVAITQDTNIIAENIKPGYTPLASFVIYACFETQGQLKVRRKFTDLNVTKTEILNEGNNLVSECAYIFAIPVSENETINIWFSTNTVATKLLIIESQIE